MYCVLWFRFDEYCMILNLSTSPRIHHLPRRKRKREIIVVLESGQFDAMPKNNR